MSQKILKNRGAALLTTLIFLLVISVIVVLGVASSAFAERRIIAESWRSRQSFFASESGVEDVVYRFKSGKMTSAIQVLGGMNNTTASTSVAVVNGDQREITALAVQQNTFRKSRALVSLGSGVSFNYGVQSGNGGIILENSASVRGNVYSNGPIDGSNSNIVRGDVVSAGASGLIDGVHATGTAYARTIRDSTIDGDAYYQNISGTIVGGTLYPGSPNQPPAELPISDALIEEWKATALAGGVTSSPCPLKINSATTLGPRKIACDLEIEGNNYNITLNGPIWVEGNILIKNSPNIYIATSLGNQSVPIIADDPSDRLSGSRIMLENSVDFFGSGSSGSYVVFISQNESAENGGSNRAIDIKNSVDGDLLVYAGHGEIELQNNISLKEVTGYRIRIKNSAEVIYETGLASLLFTSGPGGGYQLQGWGEAE